MIMIQASALASIPFN